jgi:hypothetical protein
MSRVGREAGGLDPRNCGPHVNDRLILRGTIDSDHRVPRVVVDGREISWD